MLFAVFMLCGCLVACNDSGDTVDGGEKGDSWANLDFKDSTLTISVSANADEEVTFGSAHVYTKAPDKPSQETVQKKVLLRNKKVAEDLDINVEYQTTDYWYDGILPHLEQLVGGDATDAPDVYNNDILPMATAMLNGSFWNVTDPGKDASGTPVKSYFDFDEDCWYEDYIEGATLSGGKLYLLVGDYNIDILRFAWVFFVNINLWNAAFGSLSEEDGWGFTDYESACTFIAETEDWFYDDVIALASLAHNDAGGSTQGKTDRGDAQIGLCINSGAPVSSFGAVAFPSLSGRKTAGSPSPA